MLIEFNKKTNFYDNLENNLYGDGNKHKDKHENEIINQVIYNFIPVKILDGHYILTSLKNLESYLIDYREDIIVKIYISHIVKSHRINSVVSFTEKDYNPSKQYDCYIDSINNLILIKFHCGELNYIEFDNSLNIKSDLYEHKQNITLTYIWTNHDLENQKITRNSEIKFVWDNKYINLPEIPYILDIPNINKKFNPMTGSAVFNENNLIGMVSYINNTEIIITPLIIIKKIIKYLKGDNILFLGLDLFPVNFNFKSELNKIGFENGLLIGNNYYDIYKKLKKNTKSEINNELTMSNVLKQNNEQDQKQKQQDQKQDQKQDQDKKQIQFTHKPESYQLTNTNINNKLITNIAEELISNIEETLKNYKTIEKHTDSEIYPDIYTFMKLNIDKRLCEIENKKYLSRKNIICAIDNYKINSNGHIIISKNKTIPFKSYLWLFKSFIDKNNNLNLSIIPNNIYNINLIELNNKIISINDSYIKKKISIIEKNVFLNDKYNEISSFNSSEIKYIEYKNNIILELNEKILFMMKKLIMSNQYLYQDVFSKIFSSRYTHNSNKIIIGINFNNEFPKLTIINNYKNFDLIIKKYKTKKELKRFILSNT